MKFLWKKRGNLNLGAYGISHPICLKLDFWTFKIHTVLGKLMLPISTALNRLHLSVFKFFSILEFFIYIYRHIQPHIIKTNLGKTVLTTGFLYIIFFRVNHIISMVHPVSSSPSTWGPLYRNKVARAWTWPLILHLVLRLRMSGATLLTTICLHGAHRDNLRFTGYLTV